MKRMAQVDANGIVTNIIIANDDWNVEGFVEYTDENPACIGGTYENGKFIPPKRFASWILNEKTYQWEAPVAYPNDGKMYFWDESTISWVVASPPIE
jgi:hypothetical protein